MSRINEQIEMRGAINEQVELGGLREADAGIQFMSGLREDDAGIEFAVRGLSGLREEDADIQFMSGAVEIGEAVGDDLGRHPGRMRVRPIRNPVLYRRAILKQRSGHFRVAGLFDFLRSVPSRNEMISRTASQRKLMDAILTSFSGLTRAQRSGVLKQMADAKIDDAHLRDLEADVASRSELLPRHVERLERFEAGLPGVQRAVNDMVIGNRTAGVSVPETSDQAQRVTGDAMIHSVSVAEKSASKSILMDVVVPTAAVAGGLAGVAWVLSQIIK